MVKENMLTHEDVQFDFFNDVVFDGAQFYEAAFAGWNVRFI